MAVFNQEHDFLAEAIITQCSIVEAVDLNEANEVPRIFNTNNAMWDTGATNCLISQNVIDALGLKPIGKAKLEQAIDTDEFEETDVYLVHIALPTHQIVKNVQCVFTSSPSYDFVLGMDIITSGDFAITNREGKTLFSYQRPSRTSVRFEDI